MNHFSSINPNSTFVELLELEISDDDDETEAQIDQNDQSEDCGLSFKEISEEWKMVAWFTESICVR